MTTPRTRAIVSCAASCAAGLALTLALGACARGPSRPVLDGPASLEGPPLTIRFDNGAREHVHVYLIDRQRQWLLGRVEPGARATLPVPVTWRTGNPGFMQLAVVTGGRLTLQAAQDARATLTIAQPVSQILSQRWMFAQGQLTSLPVPVPVPATAAEEGPW
jgi:hypothetical protein